MSADRASRHPRRIVARRTIRSPRRERHPFRAPARPGDAARATKNTTKNAPRMTERSQHHNPLRGRSGAQGRSRTADTGIFSPLLYQLSYLGTEAAVETAARRGALCRQIRRACPALKCINSPPRHSRSSASSASGRSGLSMR
ncbi:protein of unknown function (plasmid) [Azospirillum baldaniorum]|uniref:Uncharacterized protein n=1 Tax=Azospirillum baldaniorum TaxID=1064539 RepID=A0A9P1JVS3_9PROT|nr:protein of unknown function [Azospirillum baldaniorum]